MALPFDAFQRLAPPLRDEDKARLLTRLQAQFDDETDEIAAAAWAMGARAFCNSALGRTICRVCGCWELQACADGCSWVEPDLCSRCAPTPNTTTAEANR